jgi:hydrogenase/urease accessory protein HupE
MRYWPLAVCTLALLFPTITSAHVVAYGTVSTELDVSGTQINLQTETSQNINVYGYPPDEQRDLYQKYFSDYLIIKQGSTTCPFTLTYYDPSYDTPHGIFRGNFTCPSAITRPDDISIHSEIFFDQFQNFDHFMTLTIGAERYSLPFSATKKDFPGDVAAKALGNVLDYFVVAAAQFLWMGMMHIFTGYDHILFLISVVLLARSLKKIFFLVTSFTAAHSITFLLASFHVVTLSSGIVEPSIAATILFMAVRNVLALKKGTESEHDHRVPLTFAFGLIHGLGFASALADTTIPSIFFVPALLTFNVGIELGQLTILAVVLPLLWYIDSTRLRTRILTVFSYTVCVLATFWIVVRIFF